MVERPHGWSDPFPETIGVNGDWADGFVIKYWVDVPEVGGVYFLGPDTELCYAVRNQTGEIDWSSAGEVDFYFIDEELQDLGHAIAEALYTMQGAIEKYRETPYYKDLERRIDRVRNKRP